MTRHPYTPLEISSMPHIVGTNLNDINTIVHLSSLKVVHDKKDYRAYYMYGVLYVEGMIGS